MRLSDEWVRKLDKMEQLESISPEPIAVVDPNKKSPVLTQDPEAMKRIEGLLTELFPYDPSDE